MATHSSVLAWRIPGTGDPGGLPSMGSHRVGHDWSNLAAAVLSYEGFPGAASGKEPACQCRRQEMWVQSLSGHYPLEEGMATHSSILAWRIIWTEEPGGLQSIVSQRVGHNWSDLALRHSHDPLYLYGISCILSLFWLYLFGPSLFFFLMSLAKDLSILFSLFNEPDVSFTSIFFFFCSFYLVLWVYTSFLLLTLDLFVLLLVSLGVSIGCLLEIFLVSWGRLLLLIIISYNYFFASHSFWVIAFLIFHVSSGIFWFPLWFL